MTKPLNYRELPPHLLEVSTLRGVFNVLRCWVPVVILGAIAGTWPAQWWSWCVALLGIGILQYHMNILAHSGQHAQLARSRRLNDFLANWFLQAPLGLPFRRMQRVHFKHHADLGGAEDEDRWYFDLLAVGRDTPARLDRWLLGMFCGATMVKHALGAGRFLVRRMSGAARTRPRSASPARAVFRGEELVAVVVTQILLVTFFTLVTGAWWAYALLWLVPRFTIMTGLNGVRACIEHADLGEPPGRMKTYVSTRFERLLLSPFNMNYHGEHHVYMQVPYEKLPEIRRMLAADDSPAAYRVMSSYFADYRRVRQQLAQAHA